MTQRPSRPSLEVVSNQTETAERGNRLEDAIGRQVHIYRTQLGVTIANLARQAGLSPGMLSKIFSFPCT